MRLGSAQPLSLIALLFLSWSSDSQRINLQSLYPGFGGSRNLPPASVGGLCREGFDLELISLRATRGHAVVGAVDESKTPGWEA